MAKIKGAVVVNQERCKGCNLCVVACPSDVLELHPREVNNKRVPLCVHEKPGCLHRLRQLRIGLSRRLFNHLQSKNIKQIWQRRDKINERERSHRPRSYPLRCRRILRIPYHSAIGDPGNPDG